jgi:hypothetical protein
MRAPCSGSFLVLVIAACEPAPRDPVVAVVDAPSGRDAPGICAPVAEDCADGIDNDCDQRVDCADSSCSGVGNCPVCGAVENPLGQPLALPDGTSQATPCTTNAQCGAGAPNCVQGECHASYTATLNFIGFPQHAALPDEKLLRSVCVTMEHSWLRDLQIDLIPPDNRLIQLHAFVQRTGSEIYLGEPNDNDGATPSPGVGYQYCWKPSGAQAMLESPTVSINGHATLPAGDYKSVTPWLGLFGSPLNGAWTLRVTDLWSVDNGFIFKWSIAFDPTLIDDCSGPIIL